MLERPFANIKHDGLSEIFPELGLQTIRGFAELESTNSWVIQHAASFTDDQLPLLVVCDSQTAGRGRLGRRWHADSGTLTFSLLCEATRLGVTCDKIASLALLVGVSVAEAIDSSIPPHSARIKWPNDVLVAGRKVAGILIENIPAVGIGTVAQPAPPANPPSESQSAFNTAASTTRFVVGIGVNVATDFGGVPEEVRLRAGSLAQLAGRPIEPAHLLSEILQRIHENSKDLACDGLAPLIKAVRSRCCLTGQRVRLSHGGQVFTGKCCGLSPSGELLLELDSGVVAFQSGEAVRIEGS